MKWGIRLLWILCLVALAGIFGACGNGDEPEPDPTPPPEPGPLPPADPDLDIEPNRPPPDTEWNIQENPVTSSNAIPNELSPAVFGQPLCFRLVKRDTPGHVDVTSVTLPFGSNKLKIYIDISGSVAYMRTDQNGDTHMQPYDPAQHNNNNFLWPDILWTLDTAPGKMVEFTAGGQDLATPASNLKMMKIYLKDPNKPDEECPVAEEEEEEGEQEQEY